MKKDIKTGICILLAFVAWGCSSPKTENLSAGSYRQFVENPNNHLRATVKSGVWDYTFQYRPAPYIALVEAGGEPAQADSLKRRIAGLKNTMWFNVALSAGNKTADPLKFEVSGLEEYNSRLTYFLEQAGQNFRLFYGSGEAVPPAGYFFENNYSIKPEVVMIVAFQIPDSMPRQKVVLEYYDGLFNAGILKFGLVASVLQNIPFPAALKAQDHV